MKRLLAVATFALLTACSGAHPAYAKCQPEATVVQQGADFAASEGAHEGILKGNDAAEFVKQYNTVEKLSVTADEVIFVVMPSGHDTLLAFSYHGVVCENENGMVVTSIPDSVFLDIMRPIALHAQPSAYSPTADEKVCNTVDQLKALAPKSEFKQFTPEQFAFFKNAMATNKNTRPIPDSVATVYLTAATDDPNTVVILGYDKDGCFVGSAQMPVEMFVKLLGGMPKASQSSHQGYGQPWNGEV